MRLEVEDLSVEYGGRRALDGASLSAGAGECVGVAGESGCGKSTLGLAVARSLDGGRAVGGSVRIDGRDVLSMPAREFDAGYRWSRVSVVFQGAMSSLDPVYTVGAQLAQVLSARGFRGDARARAGWALREAGLGPGAARLYPHEMSGGMRQRAALAAALLLRPSVVVADEPATALDALSQARAAAAVRRLCAAGVAVLLITHDLAALEGLADRAAVMYAGRVVEFGPAGSVLGSPAHPYTRALLAAAPRIGGPRPRPIPGRPPAPGGAAGCRFAGRCPEAFGPCGREPPGLPREGGYSRCWLGAPT